MNKLCLFLAASVLILSSCGTTRIPLFKGSLEKEKQQAWKKIEQNNASFTFFSGKGKVKVNNGSSDISFTLNLRIKSDSIIWASITALAGIEVARAYITPDSVKVLDKLNNKYIHKSFTYFNELLNADIDFSMLQAALTSKRPAAIEEKNSTFNIDSTGYLFSGIIREMEYVYGANTKFKPARLSFSDIDLDQNMDIRYDEYTNKTTPIIPQHIFIKSRSGKDKVEVDIRYSKTTLDEPLEFPFNVSKKFD